MLAIVITDSTGHSHFLPLPNENGRRFTLGRSEQCDFSFPNEQTLADYHCMFTLVDGYVYLQAYESEYGIFAGSREVREEYMTNEKEYTLGSCRLMITQTEDETPSAEQAQPTVTRVAKLQPKSVTRVAKLQPKSVTQTTAQPATPPVTRVAKLQPKAVTRVAKLQPKSVSHAAPVYEVPVEQYAPAEPVYEAPVEQYAPAEPVYEAPVEQYAPAEPVYEAPVEQYAPAEPVYEAPVEQYAPAEPVYEAPVEQYAPAEPVYEAPVEQPAPAEPVYEAPIEQPAPAEPVSQVAAVSTATASTSKKSIKTTGKGAQKAVRTAAGKNGKKPRAFKTAAGTVAGTKKSKAVVKTPAKKVRSVSGKVTKKAARTVAKPTYAPEAERTGVLAQLPTDFDLKLRLANKEETLNIGTELRFGLLADRNCYLYLVQYDCEGHAGLLVPGMADVSNTLHGGNEAQFPNVGNKDYHLMVEAPVGRELIIAIACTKPCNFDTAWQNIISSSLSQQAPGTAELQAIETCSEDGQIWASAIIYITTCE